MTSLENELLDLLKRAERKLGSLGIEDVGRYVEIEEGRVTPAYQLLKDCTRRHRQSGDRRREEREK